MKVVTEYQECCPSDEERIFPEVFICGCSEKKKAAVGVRGIKLQKKDELEEVYLFEEGTETKITYGEKDSFTEPPETGEKGWNRNQKPLEVLPEAETVKKEKSRRFLRCCKKMCKTLDFLKEKC